MKTTAKLFLLVIFLLSQLSSAIAQNSTDINTYNRFMKKGSEQLQAGDYHAARDSFNEALRYFEGGASGHLGLGLAYFHLRDDKYAERELSRAAATRPGVGGRIPVAGRAIIQKRRSRDCRQSTGRRRSS